MNKKEKMFFIGKLFSNNINYKGDKQYSKSIEILLDFHSLDMISDELFDECKLLLKKVAYEDSLISLLDLQDKLCVEFGLPTRYD